MLRIELTADEIHTLSDLCEAGMSHFRGQPEGRRLADVREKLHRTWVEADTAALNED